MVHFHKRNSVESAAAAAAAAAAGRAALDINWRQLGGFSCGEETVDGDISSGLILSVIGGRGFSRVVDTVVIFEMKNAKRKWEVDDVNEADEGDEVQEGSAGGDDVSHLHTTDAGRFQENSPLSGSLLKAMTPAC